MGTTCVSKDREPFHTVTRGGGSLMRPISLIGYALRVPGLQGGSNLFWMEYKGMQTLSLTSSV